MAQIIFIFILIIPATLGLAEILHYLKQVILSSNHPSKIICIKVLKEENAVSELYSFCNEINWSRKNHHRKFFAVYNQLTDETYNECKLIAENNGVLLINTNEILKEII